MFGAVHQVVVHLHGIHLPPGNIFRPHNKIHLFGIQAIISAAAAAIAIYATVRIAVRDFGRQGVIAMWPMLLFVLGFTLLQLVILAQPMEMRGTVLGPTF